jgi:thiamine transport system ATP-binding protein
MIKIENGLYASADFSLRMDFEILAGEFCAVLGPSGAGKTTLLSMIAGFENLQTGTLTLGDVNVTKMPPALRPVSMIFQDHNAFAHLDVWANVALGISPALRLGDSQRETVERALQSVNLLQLAKRKPGDISGGERQRIALARVLVRDQPILLLDEPFAALDPGLRADMLDLVTELQKKHRLTVLLVTHQPEEAKRAATKILFVSQGDVSKPLGLADFFTSDDRSIEAYRGKRS